MTPQVFESGSIGEITKSVLALDTDERDRIRSAIFSGMALERMNLRDPMDTIDEIRFIVEEMTEDELGDFNEWADVTRVQKIREALNALDKE